MTIKNTQWPGPRSGEDFRQIARLYETALAEGRYPVKALMESTGKSRATVSRWVAVARAAGYIRWSGSDRVNKRVLDVANEMGVPYSDLFDALRKHAGPGGYFSVFVGAGERS